MMKTNRRKLDVKTILIVFLSILGSFILAGAIVVGILQFNGDSTTSNKNVMQLTSPDGAIDMLQESDQEKLLTDVERLLKEQGLRITQKKILAGEGGGLGTILQYEMTNSFKQIEDVSNNAEFIAKVQQLSYFSNANGSGQTANTPTLVFAAHERAYMPYYEHIWRAAVAIGVVLIVWFGYMAIRFRLGMSITAIIMLVLDGLAMLAIVALTRIPVGISLMGSLLITLLFSAMCSTILFAKMYKNFKKPNWQDKTLMTAIYDTTKQNQKLILIFAAIIGIILGGIAIVAGCFANVALDLFGFALSTFLGLVVSVVNALYFTPVLFYSIQNSFDTAKIKKGKKVYLVGKELKVKQEESLQEDNSVNK